MILRILADVSSTIGVLTLTVAAAFIGLFAYDRRRERRKAMALHPAGRQLRLVHPRREKEHP
ncbi:MAG TPA: hypothetical protein VFQ44_02470 [Streptosporangiaceae bacterium]|nr:hypothetical protein [Streptosporangiaceae bacterium]